ncbi:DUF1206 domain-containing protein [Brevundimonas goettingensis]|nr:DUF1206 domain-containing protein [Brevundimonas goettingensis]
MLQTIRHRAARLGDLGRRRSSLLRRVPPLPVLIEMAARIGYGARGFVYASVGALTLMAALDLGDRAVGTKGAAVWLAQQPFGRLWLVLLGLGLWAFVGWRILQAVFDADREGSSARALLLRAGQAVSGLFYGLLASGVFELLDEVGPSMAVEDVAENQRKAEMLLALPFGDALLIGVGLVVTAVGVGNIIKGFSSDFGETLACSERLCRRLSLIARTGYVARGLAYLPLAVLVILAGWHARSSDVGSFGSSLDALERQPGGSWMLGLTAVGLAAFGTFAFVEARFRKIRAPRDLNPL